MAKKNVLRCHSGFGPEIEIHYVGGPKPYLWLGNDENYGYVGDRSIRKLKRFVDAITRKRRKRTQQEPRQTP